MKPRKLPSESLEKTQNKALRRESQGFGKKSNMRIFLSTALNPVHWCTNGVSLV